MNVGRDQGGRTSGTEGKQVGGEEEEREYQIRCEDGYQQSLTLRLELESLQNQVSLLLARGPQTSGDRSSSSSAVAADGN